MTAFYDGLEALRVADLIEGRGVRAQFCRDWLAKLDDRRTAAAGDDLAKVNAELAIARTYLAGECLFPGGFQKEAIKQGERALREALASGYHVIIYDCLGSLGSMYLISGNERQATVNFQRAIAYAYDPNDPAQLKYSEVLRWLGNVYAREERTLAMARMTAQWRRALEPFDVGPWRDEFIWLIQHGRTEDVERVLCEPPIERSIDAARRTAACLALGRYEDAMGAAREGRSLALKLGDDDWTRSFDRILAPQSPALQGR